MKPSAEVREELTEELVEVERKIAKKREERKEKSGAINEQIKSLEARRDELLDLIEGKEHIQPELPMTKGKTDRRGPGLTVALKDNGVPVPDGEVASAKRELARRKKGADADGANGAER